MLPKSELAPLDLLPPNSAHPSKKGLRQTEQRKAVYEALMAKTDHPSAVDVFMRVKTKMPSISLATVYNCLDTLTSSGLVRAVNHEREPSRFCANRQDHAHLFCTRCNSVTDLPLRNPVVPSEIWELPEGIHIADQQVSFRGLCPNCAENSQSPAPTAPSVATTPNANPAFQLEA